MRPAATAATSPITAMISSVSSRVTVPMLPRAAGIAHGGTAPAMLTVPEE